MRACPTTRRLLRWHRRGAVRHAPSQALRARTWRPRRRRRDRRRRSVRRTAGRTGDRSRGRSPCPRPPRQDLPRRCRHASTLYVTQSTLHDADGPEGAEQAELAQQARVRGLHSAWSELRLERSWSRSTRRLCALFATAATASSDPARKSAAASAAQVGAVPTRTRLAATQRRRPGCRPRARRAPSPRRRGGTAASSGPSERRRATSSGSPPSYPTRSAGDEGPSWTGTTSRPHPRTPAGDGLRFLGRARGTPLADPARGGHGWPWTRRGLNVVDRAAACRRKSHDQRRDGHVTDVLPTESHHARRRRTRTISTGGCPTAGAPGRTACGACWTRLAL